MWPYIDLNEMSSDAAIAISTLLAIVFFAYLVEWLTVIRTISKSAPKWYRPTMAVGLGGVTFGFVWSQLPLLAAMNKGRLAGDIAEGAWIGSALQFCLLIVGMLGATFLPRD
jgi:mannose/fructose/N-acetylgalactosamine-specific phosphotransferase system component IIC